MIKEEIIIFFQYNLKLEHIQGKGLECFKSHSMHPCLCWRAHLLEPGWCETNGLNLLLHLFVLEIIWTVVTQAYWPCVTLLSWDKSSNGTVAQLVKSITICFCSSPNAIIMSMMYLVLGCIRSKAIEFHAILLESWSDGGTIMWTL